MPTEFEISLVCGLRLYVVFLAEGAGHVKAHQGEYLWCCESAGKTHGRGYVPEFAAAKTAALRSAQVVLASSLATLAAANS